MFSQLGNIKCSGNSSLGNITFLIDNKDCDGDDDGSDDVPYDNFWKQDFDIACLNNHLKNVLLEGFSGTQCHLDFAKFVISNARVLEVMVIPWGSLWQRKWVETQRALLCLGNRASRDAQVVFRQRLNSFYA